MRVLVTRPWPDGEEIAAKLAAAGHDALLAPLLETQFFDGAPLDLGGVAAFLATSANGVRALARRTARRDLPLFAVGPQTAGQARALGFLHIENADGDARALADAVPRWMTPEQGALLHVCGRDNEGGLAERLTQKGYAVRREILYAVEALPLSQEAMAALSGGMVEAALFFSPRSARIFAAATETLSVQTITAFCISDATAAALSPLAFQDVRIAARPNQEALLALLAAQ